MIARLTGKVDGTGSDWMVLDVNGVGYLLFCSTQTLSTLPGSGETVRLEVETHVREDHIHLYGFMDTAERDWFRLLTGVQGVGAKGALAILSVLGATALLRAVAAQDKAAVTRANGVGPKLAGRIISELRDKVTNMTLGAAAAIPQAASKNALPPASILEDAISALVNLGYGRSEAFTAVNKVCQSSESEDMEVAALIQASLKELGR